MESLHPVITIFLRQLMTYFGYVLRTPLMLLLIFWLILPMITIQDNTPVNPFKIAFSLPVINRLIPADGNFSWETKDFIWFYGQVSFGLYLIGTVIAFIFRIKKPLSLKTKVGWLTGYMAVSMALFFLITPGNSYPANMFLILLYFAFLTLVLGLVSFAYDRLARWLLGSVLQIF